MSFIGVDCRAPSLGLCRAFKTASAWTFAAVGFCVTPAYAMPFSIDDAASTGGVLEFRDDGGLVGHSLSFDTLTRDTDPVRCENCLLSFESAGTGVGRGLAAQRTGGPVRVTGSVVDGAGKQIAAGRLIDGTWISPPVSRQVTPVSVVVGGGAVVNLHEALGDWLPGVSPFLLAFTAITDMPVPDPKGGGALATVRDADVVLMPVAVPSPQTLALVVLGLVILSRRRGGVRRPR